MSLLDKISLLVTPNAVKASKLYSVIPASGTGDLTATRNTTATRVNSLGLIENVAANVPRLNYDSVGGAPSILLEGQRTNLVTFSEDYGSSNWRKLQAGTGAIPTVVINNAISPDGTLNADTVSFGDAPSGSQSIINQLPTLSAGTYTFSAYIKSETAGTKIIIRNGSTNLLLTLTTQYVRYILTVTSAAGGVEAGFKHQPSEGTVNGAVFQVWGAQLELGAFASSYIPTTASAVTRNQDLINKAGISDLIGQTEGVFFLNIRRSLDVSVNRAISISDGTNDNRILVFYGVAASNPIFFNVTAQGVVTQIQIASQSSFQKLAIRYSATEISYWLDGVLRFQTTGTFVFNTLTRLGFDSNSGGSVFTGQCKEILIFKTALTDAECVSLTTI